ncbi:MAG: hypothetical protein ACRC33_05350 [Gemmataceae bacterium]
MKTGLIGLTGVVLALGLGVGRAADADTGKDKKADEKVSLWMAKKVEFSQKILAGLTKGDFEQVETAARDMYVVGYLEKFDRTGMPAYRKQVKAFDAATKELISQAKAQDVAGATKAYTRLVVSCVECHQVVRDTKKK